MKLEHIVVYENSSTKSIKCDNINICVYALNRNKHAKLHLPSTFQTSDIELLSQKIET